VVAIGSWGVAVAAVLVTARAVGGELAARRAAPALVLLPAAVWAGTSVDPVFAALGAVAVALAATAVATPRWRLRVLGAGAVFGAGLLCSYGVVPLGLVLVVAVGATVSGTGRRAPAALPVLAAVAVGALAVLGAAAAAGFWWPAGLDATRAAYWEGIGSHRPGVYLTLVGNPAVVAIATGPLVAVGLARLRGAAVNLLWLLPAAALVTVAVADLSQLARGEVERIWLPFVPWLALAAPGDRRGWLAVQVALALVVQSVLVSPW
jgi:methylthioxylose transferase